MTTVQKFAQRVSHMIGRARHNMDTMATSSRTVSFSLFVTDAV